MRHVRRTLGTLLLVGAPCAITGCVTKKAIAVDGSGACATPACTAGSGGAATGPDASAGGSGGSASGGGGASGTGGSTGSGGTASAVDAGEAAAPLPLYTLVVDAPADGASVSGVVTVRGRAPGFLNVEVWDATHQHPPLAQTAPGTDGTFVTTVDTSSLARGATTWTVYGWDSPPGQAFTHTAGIALDLTIGAGADGGAGSCANRQGAPGHVAPTCVKKALFGGADLDLATWAQKLGRASLDLQSQWDDVTAASSSNTAAQDWGWIDGHYSVDQWVVQASWPGALALGMPMWVRGQDPSICASGANDAEMSQAIATLKAMVGDARDVYIRLGWEFNADWYPTQTSEGDAAYQQAWRDCWVRWYDAIKAVSPKYMVVWNPEWANKGACQSGYTSVLNLWPGAEFVDAAGPDQYDGTWCGTPAAYDQMDGEQPIGIGAWADWVIAQGVPFAVPEWGVDSGQWGNGDRPQFIQDVYAALKKAYDSDSGLAFQSYFDGGSTYGCRFSLLDPACNLNPSSSAEYFTLFKVWPPP